MIAEYLEHALQFERMAAEATDPALQESLSKQARAYRKLASERAERQGLPRPPNPGAPVTRPDCKKCGTRMMLARIMPVHGRPDHDARTFDCPKCGTTETEIVKFR